MHAPRSTGHRTLSTSVRRLPCALLALIFATIAPLHAQPRSDSTRAALRLRVLGDGNAPVPDAEVSLKRDRNTVTARTDSLGETRFELPQSGLWRATIRRIGFGPANLDLRVGEGENALIVHLDRTTATLDEVRIIANRPSSARLDDFETRRMRQDASSTITLQDIEKRNPIKLSQMLRTVGGLRIGDSLGNIVAISSRGQKSTLMKNNSLALVQCVMRVAVDGTMLPALSNIDQILPKDVYGVEVFNGPARIPPQFGGLRTDNWCGLILIWTRER